MGAWPRGLWSDQLLNKLIYQKAERAAAWGGEARGQPHHTPSARAKSPVTLLMLLVYGAPCGQGGQNRNLSQCLPSLSTLAVT